MKGLGTDENAVVEVIASHTNEQRQAIKDKYKTMYGKVSSTIYKHKLERFTSIKRWMNARLLLPVVFNLT